ncbi:MAG: hypothetical protein ACI9SP_002107 [Arenicella sp.]|jgi:hypothetical protein
MSFTYQALLFIHVAVGFISLILFWIPVVAKKGGPLHIRTGHWYAKTMYLVGFSALILALMLMIDPISFKFPDNDFNPDLTLKVAAELRAGGLFLLAISILVLVGVRHGLQSVRAKGNQDLMRRTDSLLINIALLAIGVWLGFTAVGGSPMSVLYYIFSALCSVTAITNLRFCLKRKVTRGEQIVAHISGIIGAGIGSHTAFFVFGANRFLSQYLTGYAGIIPWALPGVVGTLIIFQQSKKYRPRKAKATATA